MCVEDTRLIKMRVLKKNEASRKLKAERSTHKKLQNVLSKMHEKNKKRKKNSLK